MRIKKTFAAGAGLVFLLDVVAPDRSRSKRGTPSGFAARAYITLKIKNKNVNPLVGARYEAFWLGVVDRALQIAFPNQISRIDEAIWVVSRGAVDGPVRLMAGLQLFERIFQVAITGVDPYEENGLPPLASSAESGRVYSLVQTEVG
jgi:hypothetical protein